MSRNLVVPLALLLVSIGPACSRPRERPPISRAETDIATRSPQQWLAEEPVRLLRDYVRIDTTTEQRGEEEGVRFLERFFDCAAIESEVICPAPRRCNLFARLPGKRSDGALLLLNHVDVAPALPALWKQARPFEGKIDRGYLYGRGVYDMKSIAIAQALAMRNLKRHGIVPPSDVLFLAEADEEIAQKLGARWLLERRPELFRGVGQVLNEGGLVEVILRNVRFWGIETLQAGYATAELEAETAGAIRRLADRWRKLDSPVVEPHPQVVIGFDLLANHLVSPLTDPLRHLERVRRDPAELAVLPDRYGSFLEARVYWSRQYFFPPKTEERARMWLVVSTPPGIAPERFFDPILADARANGVRVVSAFASGATGASPYPTAFTEILRRTTEAYFPGVPFGPIPTYGGFTTSVLFRQKGFATYGFSPIPMNITDASRRHGNDERVFLPDYLGGVRLYRDVLEEFALPPPGVRELSVARQSN